MIEAEISHGKQIVETMRSQIPNQFEFPLNHLTVTFSTPTITMYADIYNNVLHARDDWQQNYKIHCFYIEFGVWQFVLPMHDDIELLKHFLPLFVQKRNVLNLPTTIIHAYIPMGFMQKYTSPNELNDVCRFVSDFHPVASIRNAALEQLKTNLNL